MGISDSTSTNKKILGQYWFDPRYSVITSDIYSMFSPSNTTDTDARIVRQLTVLEMSLIPITGNSYKLREVCVIAGFV